MDKYATERIDVAALTTALRFVLPAVGTDLGSSRLLSLLCLDWINKELNLNLELATLWRTELTTSNIILFFCDCFELSPDSEVDLGEVEASVVPAMREFKPSLWEQVQGPVRLQAFVTRVLDSGRAVDWVSKYGCNIAHVLTTIPNAQVLERCLRRNKEFQDMWRDRDVEVNHERQLEEVMHRIIDAKI